MATKLSRKEFPAGYNPNDFKYQGRPSKDQGDFGDEVGIADMVCVNQFGEANKAKHYHGGVLQTTDGVWWVYLEWGRISPGKSWDGSFRGQDFQFVKCSSEPDARSFFKKQLTSKNTRRLEKKDIGGKEVWAGKAGKDGYIVQRLAARERGLPDAYTIKDNSGVAKVTSSGSTKKKETKASTATKVYNPHVVSLAQSLVGGVQTYARAQSEATGVIPTMEAIEEIRNVLLPLALEQLARIGDNEKKQLSDKKLIDISNLVASMVPRPIPRNGTAEARAKAVILSSGNILSIQQDLDTFESSLLNEDFSVDTTPSQVNPDQLLGAKLDWIDPNSAIGKWLIESFNGMSNNRHGYMGRGGPKILNMFTVSRPGKDSEFVNAAKEVSERRSKHDYRYRAGLQPRRRIDLADISDYAERANIFFGIHGTRPVNVQPILSSNLRLPRTLKGVKITGAAFGHGIYFATDWRKSYGYTGHGRAYYGGGGQIQGRGFFMFLNDVICGKPYMARSTGSWASPPENSDSIFAHPSHIRSLANDEHIIFNPNYQRIRYVIEGTI